MNDKKRRSIFDYHRVNADILVLIETHSIPENECIWINEWGGKILFSHGTTKSRGIAVLISKTMGDKIINIEKCSNGRYIIFDIIENGETVSIAAIYAPNEDSPVFFKQIRESLKKRQEKKVIIGDFNLTLNVEKDRLNTYCNNNQAKEEVLNIMDEFYLKDVWRVRNEDKLEYSWSKKTVRSEERKASRIDFTLVSGGLDQSVELIQYLSSIMTDHRAIYMVLELTQKDRGAGYWKLNSSLLQDKTFVDKVNKEICVTIEAAAAKNPVELWECLKLRIKKAAQNYSRQKSSESKVIIANLSEKVNQYEEMLPLDQEDDDLYEQTKAELEEKMLERISGVMFRSKARWYELGEKNTKYFFALEKAKYNSKTCNRLCREDGTLIEKQEEILGYQQEFYQELYREDEGVKFTMRNTFGVFVPEDIRVQQDMQVQNVDLEYAIKYMNNGKTPGEDGLPVEFYKVFWTRVKEPFLNMVAHVYDIQKLHKSGRTGILNLIPKPNKDSRYIKNLRPITLLNTDYKIIEKAIANKMLPALKHIIHQDQRGFMKERRISVNIRKMLDIIHQANQEDLEAVVLSLDFVKCFDKCSFDILHGSLEFFGFGEIVKTWTRILYKDFSVKIQNNGNFSGHISIDKGVHQGGCCSSIYFLVIAEILALALRADSEIQGITFRDIRNLLNQFADDMDIFSLADETSIRHIHGHLEWFKSQSGFTVSYDKTTMYRIGSLRHSNAQLYGLDQIYMVKPRYKCAGSHNYSTGNSGEKTIRIL